MTYIKATEALNAEQLITKSNLYVEYNLIHMQKRNIDISDVYRPKDYSKSNLYVEYHLIHMQKRNIDISNMYRRKDCSAEKFINHLIKKN